MYYLEYTYYEHVLLLKYNNIGVVVVYNISQKHD